MNHKAKAECVPAEHWALAVAEAVLASFTAEFDGTDIGPDRADDLHDYASRRVDVDQVDKALAPLGLECVDGGTEVVHVSIAAERVFADVLLRDALVPFCSAFSPHAWAGAADQGRTSFEGERLLDNAVVHWRLLKVPILDVAGELMEDIGNAADSVAVP